MQQLFSSQKTTNFDLIANKTQPNNHHADTVVRPVADTVLQHPSSTFDTKRWLQAQQCQNT